MSRRIARFHAGNITGEMRELFEATTARIRQRRDASPAMRALMDEQDSLTGPPNAWLLSPAVGTVFETMVGVLRSSISLAPRCAEIIILLVAGHAASAFEIFAHRLAASSLGLADAQIEALLQGDDRHLDDPLERAVAAATQALLASRDLDDAHYAQAVSAIGQRGLFELVVLIGIYPALAMQLSVFRIVPD
jgi:4-carboxymuconolactone decarboxylase